MDLINSFTELYSLDYNLTKIFAMKQTWKNGRNLVMNRPRSTNALILMCGCDGVFKTKQKSINVLCDSLFFIPQGAEYTWTFLNCNKAISTLLFEFEITNQYGKVVPFKHSAGVVSFDDYKITKILFNNIIDEFQKPVNSPAKIKAAAYSLLSACAREGRKSEIKNGNHELIYNGIKYLEDEARQEKSISEIAAMCNISTNYFERLFKEYAGCTPSKYRLNKRIERAKVMLSADILTIQQISDELGFQDSAYFCRIFKSITGYTPNQYRKSII